jgi:tripartite ATP-independent transporter DctM subunit
MILVILLAVVMVLLGAPLFSVLALVGIGGFIVDDTPLAAGIGNVYRLAGAEAVSLSTIPLFTFAGYLMAQAQTAKRLIRMAEAVMGWVPGGLALVTLWICAFFTTFTGASGVTIVAVGGLILPALLKSNYGQRFSIEVVTGSGAVGLLFPPSLPLIVYGIVYGLNASQLENRAPFSIDRFLFAGIVPGLVLLGILSIYCIYEGVRSHTPRTPLDLKGFASALWEAKWEVPIPFFIIGGLAFGLMTIPESAALTAVYVFVIEVFVYRDVSLRRDFLRVGRESMTLVGAIFVKIASATVLTAYMINAEIPTRLFEWMSQYVTETWQFLLILNVLLLLVGCLMDIFSAIVVVVPLIIPAANQFGIDPYHLGIIFLLNLEIGYILPPAGLNLFIAAFRFNRPITELYRAVVPFIVLMFVALMIVTYVPKLTVVPKDTQATVGAPAASAPGGDAAADGAAGGTGTSPTTDGGYVDPLEGF